MDIKWTKGANVDSKRIREKVFISEQGFKEEFDDIDEYAETLVIYDGTKALATGRVYEEETGIFKLGRIAVYREYRMMGLGRTIIEEMERHAKEMGAKTYHISAQVRAVPFYEKCGYEAYGDTYYEEHVKHIGMTKKA